MIGDLYKVCGEILQMLRPKMRQFSFAQIIQSARLSVQSFELGPPPPALQANVRGSKGGDTLAFAVEGGGPIRTAGLKAKHYVFSVFLRNSVLHVCHARVNIFSALAT